MRRSLYGRIKYMRSRRRHHHHHIHIVIYSLYCILALNVFSQLWLIFAPSLCTHAQRKHTCVLRVYSKYFDPKLRLINSAQFNFECFSFFFHACSQIAIHNRRCQPRVLCVRWTWGCLSIQAFKRFCSDVAIVMRWIRTKREFGQICGNMPDRLCGMHHTNGRLVYLFGNNITILCIYLDVTIFYFIVFS